MCHITAGGLARTKMGSGGGMFQPQGWPRRLARGEVHRAGCMGCAAHPDSQVPSSRCEQEQNCSRLCIWLYDLNVSA